jgi:hypothetical protein
MTDTDVPDKPGPPQIGAWHKRLYNFAGQITHLRTLDEKNSFTTISPFTIGIMVLSSRSFTNPSEHAAALAVEELRAV